MSSNRGGGRSISSDTKSLVSNMMKQSGLTPFQQRQLMQKMSSGTALPKTCNPTSSEIKKPPVNSKSASKGYLKILNPKNTTGGKRHMSKIDKVDRDIFKPAKSIDREAIKTFHQESLLYGKNGAEARQALRQKAKMKQLEAKPVRRPDREDEVDETFDPYTNEEFLRAANDVAELQNHLVQMERAGAADFTKKGEIKFKLSQRLRDMKKIDRARLKLLENKS